MLKYKLQYILLFILFTFTECRKDVFIPDENIRSPYYGENYKYYPIKDGREWNYETTIVDSIKGTTEIIEELAKFNEDSSRTDYYRDGKVWSYTYWLNYNNKLICCDNRVLVDYNQIDCTSDSVLICQKEYDYVSINIYQYCEPKFAQEVPAYNDIKCIKTVQFNIRPEGDRLVIINYFGFEVGLIFRQQFSFDKFGQLTKQETKKLISHNF